MFGGFFKKKRPPQAARRGAAGAPSLRQGSRRRLRQGLRRDLLTRMVGGPDGASDQALWTLLLRQQPKPPGGRRGGR